MFNAASPLLSMISKMPIASRLDASFVHWRSRRAGFWHRICRPIVCRPMVCCAVAILLLAPACRSGRGVNSLVKVTETSNVPDSDVPSQRLVGSDRELGGTLTPRDAVAEDRRVSLASAALGQTKTLESDTPKSNMPESIATDPADSVAAMMPKSEAETAKYESMMKAFESYPPQVRREAMRRLTASMASTAAKTNQPIGVADALSQQLTDLPPLPPVDSGSDRVAQRIGGNSDAAAARTRQVSTWGPNDSSPSPSPTMAKDPLDRRIATSRRRRSTSPRAANQPSASPQIAAAPEASSLAQEMDMSADDMSEVGVQDMANKQSMVANSPKPRAGVAPSVQIATLPLGAFSATTPTTPSDTLSGPSAPSAATVSVDNAIAKTSGAMPRTAVAATNASATTADLADMPVSNRTAAITGVAHPTHSVLDHGDSPVAQVAATQSDVENNPLATADDAALFERLIEKLSIAPENETDAAKASRLIKLQHLLVLSGDPDAASKEFDGMSESEQKYLRHQLQGLWTMVDPDGHPIPRRRLTIAAKELRAATRHAAAGSDSLEVRNVSFCTAIEAYGQTTPFKSNRFKPGQQVILYCEVENFTAEKISDGFETHLQGSYDILDADGVKVDGQLLPADRQVSSNYLRDYFIACQMGLPSDLPPGKYTLQLTIEDLNGKKYGQGSVPLSMTK